MAAPRIWTGCGLPSSGLENSLSSLSRGLPLFLCCTSLQVSYRSKLVGFIMYDADVWTRETNLLPGRHTSPTRSLHVTTKMGFLAVDTGRRYMSLCSSRWLSGSHRRWCDHRGLLHHGSCGMATSVRRDAGWLVSIRIALRALNIAIWRMLEVASLGIVEWLPTRLRLPRVQLSLLQAIRSWYTRARIIKGR
jgi:hypothetical protein